MSAKPITVVLSIAKVESGGNTGQGQYFFSFDHNTILITEENTPITFQLAPETASSFSISTIISSDSTGQVEIPLRGTSSRSFGLIAHCKVKALFSLAVVIEDTGNQKLAVPLVCDPQVICIPTKPPLE
jgi:hypothetical protein